MKARHASTLLLGLLLIGGCGGSPSNATPPPAPAGPPPPPANGVAFHVYNSSTGFVRSVTRTVAAGESVVLSVADLASSSVDPRRMAIRRLHAGEQLGALVTFTVTGQATVAVQPGEQYEVFLMNASNSVSYDCLDYTGERGAGGIAVRYATLRRAHAGEPDILPSLPVVHGPDDHFKWAADVMTRALNPFGIRYGSVTFTTGSTADVRAAWADIPSGMGRAAPGAYAVWKDYRSYPSNQVPTALHELVHAWLGAPDYYNNTGCWEGRGLSGLLFQGGGVSDPLSPRGQDGVRYWALKTDSWR